MVLRRVFVVSSAGLGVWHRQGSKRFEPFSFDADDEGIARFERYLERCPDDAARVVADVVEEEFREETIPHVLAWERRALLRTRATRAFPGARCVHTTKLGREPGGRRDDRVLFSAITRPEVLAPWLAPMARHGVPIAGIHSPAMLTGAMLKALGADGEHVLVVSLQSGGGLRQTCFRHGKLHLSRLAAVPESGAGRYGSEILDEVERTRRYLGTLRTRTDEDRLDVYVLLHGEPLETLRHALRRGPGDESRLGIGHEPLRAIGDDPGRDAGHEPRRGPARESWPGPADGSRDGYHLVDLAGVARKLGMRRWGGEPTADRLFVHLLATRPPPNHYATPDQTGRFATLRARASLRAASVVLVAGACLFGGAVALEGVTASGHARSFALHAVLYESRYRAARATLPPAPAEPAELERVVSAAVTLHDRRADPIDLLALVSDALAGFPRVRIEGLAWRTSGDAEAPVGGEGADGSGSFRGHGAAVSVPGDLAGGADPDRAGVLRRDAAAVPAYGGPAGREEADGAGPGRAAGGPRHGPGARFLVAHVSARIEPFDGDYRAAIDTVRRFARALAASPRVEHIRILALPLELGSEHTLTGAAGTAAGAAAFELRVALRAPVPAGAEA